MTGSTTASSSQTSAIAAGDDIVLGPDIGDSAAGCGCGCGTGFHQQHDPQPR